MLPLNGLPVLQRMSHLISALQYSGPLNHAGMILIQEVDYYKRTPM